MLVLTRRTEETVDVGDEIVVKVVGIKGNKVQLGFVAPKNIEILRSELKKRAAAGSNDEAPLDVVYRVDTAWSQDILRPYQRAQTLASERLN